MAKLTTRQKNKIIADYIDGDGKVSQEQLAQKYGVNRRTISRILSNEEVRNRVSNVKKDSELSMIEYIRAKSYRVQHLIDIALDTSEGQMAGACLRDKMGAVKILVEKFLPPDEDRNGEASNRGEEKVIKFVFEDTSINKDDNGNKETT